MRRAGCAQCPRVATILRPVRALRPEPTLPTPPLAWRRCLHQLTHAYAVSVHKAQGAEFPAVVIPLLTSHAPMLGRMLLYTAVTRARRLVVIVGQRRALAMAVKDWRRQERHTALAGLLAGTLRFAWPRQTAGHDGGSAPPEAWEGVLDGGPGA